MKVFVTTALILLFAGVAHADHTGIVYEQGSNKQKVLYNFSGKVTKDDGKEQTMHAVFTDPEGKEVVTDDAVLQGSNIVRDEIHQLQTNQSGTVEVRDGRIYFTKVDGDRKSTKDEKLKDTFVMSANFQKFIKDHWEPIAAGKTVSFRYGVWDRQETVGFEIFKIGDEKIGDQDAVVLKMKPSSFIIAALVNPLIFKYAADGSHLLEMNGRIPPKRKDGDRWKDLDAEVVYSYTETTTTTTTVPKK